MSTELYGIMAEFESPEALIRAARAAHTRGFREMDAFTPYPVDGIAAAIGFKRDSVAMITLLGGIFGGTLAFLMQWYANVVDYPINIGGRPDYSWPAFIPVTFELTVLGAALFAGFGMLALNHLPKPWHPAFNSREFNRASRDRFFLCIEAKDPLFESQKIHDFLKDFEPKSVSEVPLLEAAHEA